MKFEFVHFNFNVVDIEKSKLFYAEALGLKEKHRIEDPNGEYLIVYLSDGKTGFELELTELKAHPQKYDLGEAEFHLALVAEDYEKAKQKHKGMGCICFENNEMGIYFIEDPDGYWIEILPAEKSL